MRTTFIYPLLSLCILLLVAFTYKSNKAITLFIIGDSTAANKLPNAYPETGWGMEIGSFFKHNVKVDNHAVNGRSTKSFLNENRWEVVLKRLKSGDYVLIQFGHNDEKIDKTGTGTSLMAYKVNLLKFIRDTQLKKAQPILLTPIMRRSFVNGVFNDTHGGYPDVVRKLADSLQIPLIDMHYKTEQLILDLGEVSSVKLFNHLDSGHVNYSKGVKDNTHLSPEGAKAVATLVAQGIKQTKTPIVKYLKNL